MAKIWLKNCDFQTNGNYVVVTGITPTPLGEGKLYELFFEFFFRH